MANPISFGGVAASLGTSITQLFFWGAVVIFLLALVAILGYWSFVRIKWNLKVEFKLARSNNGAIYSEHGKGCYDASKGFCLIKRPGFRGRKYEIKNFDPTKYLQGTDTLTVVQVGALEFRPVIPESFMEIQDVDTGATASVMKLSGQTGDDIVWQQTQRRALREAFTMKSFLNQYGTIMGYGFLILITILGQFIGFGMILDRIKG